MSRKSNKKNQKKKKKKIRFFYKYAQKRLPKMKKSYIIFADFECSAAFKGVVRNHAAGYEHLVNNGGKVLHERID